MSLAALLGRALAAAKGVQPEPGADWDGYVPHGDDACGRCGCGWLDCACDADFGEWRDHPDAVFGAPPWH